MHLFRRKISWWAKRTECPKTPITSIDCTWHWRNMTMLPKLLWSSRDRSRIWGITLWHIQWYERTYLNWIFTGLKFYFYLLFIYLFIYLVVFLFIMLYRLIIFISKFCLFIFHIFHIYYWSMNLCRREIFFHYSWNWNILLA